MTVSSAATAKGIIPPNGQIPLINPQTGAPSSTGIAFLQQIQSMINGLSPTVTCNATFATNVYTLTPIVPAPAVPSYLDYWAFAFVAPATSTGLIMATVVPATGTLSTLQVYKNNGATQATSGDIVINMFYLLYYVDSLNSGDGGFVLK